MLAAPKVKLKVGSDCPVPLGTWWEFGGYPIAVSFNLTNWSSNSGLSGLLHLGPVGQSASIRVVFADTFFVDQVNEGKLVRIDSPQGS